MDAILSREQEELVAIGAAVAANCEPCLRYHVRQARDAGLEAAQLRAAVTLAQKVKDTPARLLREAADRLLQPGSTEAPEPARARCCG